VDQDELPVADRAALREAVLGFYEDSIRFLVVQPSGRVPRRPRPTRCWPTTWLAGRPTMYCWASSAGPTCRRSAVS